MKDKKVLLIMPTFWDTIAPPLGIVALKSFLQQYGHEVTTVNLNSIQEIWQTQNKYYKVLEEYIPCKRLIPRLGTELLSFHMNAAFFKQDSPDNYKEYIKILIKDHFQYLLINDSQNTLDEIFVKLDGIIEKHFSNLKKLVPEILVGSPQYVGCTVLSSTLASAIFILREVKQLHPEIKTVLGGPGPYAGVDVTSENLSRLAKKCSFIDKIFFGEGEVIFKDYLEGNNADNKIVSVSQLDIKPLTMDSLPYLDYSDLDLNKYFNLGIGASRGCPFMCAFCSEAKMWGCFRKMSTIRIVEEIKRQLEIYKKNKFYFADSLLNHSLNSLTELLLKENIQIKFDCYLRIDDYAQTTETTKLWSKAGLSRVRLGMESASSDILKIMNKQINPFQQAKALRSLSSVGIRTTTYWIVGHPYESEENFQETLDFIRDNKDYIYELDLAVFYFYGDGENNLKNFIDEFAGLEQRFSDKFEALSIFKYYRLKELRPSRKETFSRAVRFSQLAEELGIPCNPSTVLDFVSSERRWEDLRKTNLCS